MSQPSIPSEFKHILFDIVIDRILGSVRDFINREKPGLAIEKEKALNIEIKALKTGDKFLSFLVTESTTDDITLFAEFPEVKIPGIPNLKISLARISFTIERSINLTNNSEPIVRWVDEPYFFTIEVTLAYDNYSVALGGGENKRASISFNQYRAEIKIKDPSFYLRAFLASSNKGGFLFDVNGEIPIAIPLGPTGIGLKGLGLIYGEKFAPKFDELTTSDNAMEKLGKATATDYVNWSKKHDLTKWIPVTTDLRVFGISTTIVEMATSGKLIKVYEAGMSYVTFGPTIILGGKVNVLDTIEAGEITGAIDIHTRTLFLRAIESFPLIPMFPDAVKLTGSLELSASLNDQSKTWIAIGGYEMNGCTVNVLGFLHLEGGVRLAPFQGAAFRAAARVEGSGEVLGFGGGFSFWINISAALGWNPIEIGGDLEVGGSVWIKIFSKKIGLGVSAKLALQVPAPLLLEFVATVKLELPWPLPDLSFSVPIFKYNDPTPAAPAAPIKLPVATPLAFIHGPSGTPGALSAESVNVWPDVMFMIPFQRIAGNGQTVLNRIVGDGNIKEGRIDVSHQFTELKIEKLDHTTGIAIIIPEVRACWVYTANGTLNERTSQLAIPCTDPLNWLNSFQYALPNTSQTSVRPIFQTFGLGPSEIIFGSAAHPATKRFDRVVVKSRRTFWIQEMLWSQGYERGILAEDILIEFSLQDPYVKIPVQWCDLRIILEATETPSMSINNGNLVSTTLVREIGDRHKEWSLIITRDKSDYYSDLRLVHGERAMYIASIAYVIDILTEIETPPLVVLTPGDYRLTIRGASNASFRGHQSSQTIWDDIVRDFTVINPPLRSYLRFATQGDERLFGLEYGGWNPNPKGIGFGHYMDHLGLARSRVSYLSKIYPVLWISTADNLPAIQVSVVQCEEGTIAGSKASQEWATAIGSTLAREEEFTYDIPQTPGTKTIRIFSGEPTDVSDLKMMIDEWSYRVSANRNSIEHLLPPKTGLRCAYGPFGQKFVEELTQPSLPIGFDIDSLPKAKLANGWALPSFVQNLPNLADDAAGIRFFQFLDWAGIFDASPPIAGESVLARPNRPDLNLIFDRGIAPIGLLLRTNEPCDWRRIEFTLATGPITGSIVERMTVALLPSPDGCSCVLLGQVDDTIVRLPSGAYVLRGHFRLEMSNLPRLTRSNDHAQKIEEFHFTFIQPFGQRW